MLMFLTTMQNTSPPLFLACLLFLPPILYQLRSHCVIANFWGILCTHRRIHNADVRYYCTEYFPSFIYCRPPTESLPRSDCIILHLAFFVSVKCYIHCCFHNADVPYYPTEYSPPQASHLFLPFACFILTTKLRLFKLSGCIYSKYQRLYNRLVAYNNILLVSGCQG